ncbi:MAG: hypothetical protein ACXABX_07465, partial [Candidatus Thorarchaeota archaeon]
MTRTDLYYYHEEEKFPSHKGAIVGLLVVFGGFIALGVYSLWNLWTVYNISAIIASLVPFLADNMWLIGAALGAIVFLSVILGLGASYAARRLGGTLIYIGAVIMNLLTWGMVLVLLFTGALPLSGLLDAWPILIPGLFTLFITVLLFTVFRDRVRRAGEIIKLTGQGTLDEKGTFVPPLLTMIFTLVSAVL